MEEEVWKPVTGFPKYEVSSHGRVRSFKNNRWGTTTKPKILKPSLDTKGYPFVNLNGKSQPIHRLVCINFHPNPNNYPCVLHEDNNPTNNNYTNLKWGTYKDNNDQCRREGRNYSPLGRTNLKKKITHVLLSPEGNLVVVNNIKTFMKEYNLGRDVYLLIRHVKTSYKGWTTTFYPIN